MFVENKPFPWESRGENTIKYEHLPAIQEKTQGPAKQQL